jgi:hypothetical protein
MSKMRGVDDFTHLWERLCSLITSPSSLPLHLPLLPPHAPSS